MSILFLNLFFPVYNFEILLFYPLTKILELHHFLNKRICVRFTHLVFPCPYIKTQKSYIYHKFQFPYMLWRILLSSLTFVSGPGFRLLEMVALQLSCLYELLYSFCVLCSFFSFRWLLYYILLFDISYRVFVYYSDLI